MKKAQSSRELEIVTAVMLGLVSVVTALGAWQAAVWNSIADEYAEDAADARDVSISQTVLADYALRLDTESSANAARYQDLVAGVDPQADALNLIKVQTQLARTTPGLAQSWEEWSASGFAAEENPIADPAYIVELRKLPDSYAYVSQALSTAADTQHSKSGILAQASLVQALALFLFGIAGVNRLVPVRAGVLALGIAVFLGGLAFAATAF